MANKINYTGSSKILTRICSAINDLIETGGGGGGGSTVVVTPIVTTGTKIATISVDGIDKDLYSPTQSTPTATDINYSNSQSGLSATKVQDAIDEIAQDFQDGCDEIVSAVTAKGQTPASNSPDDIADAISRIVTGATLGTKVISANGTYNASAEGLDGYSKVIINVPVTPQVDPTLSVYVLDGELHIGIKPA